MRLGLSVCSEKFILGKILGKILSMLTLLLKYTFVFAQLIQFKVTLAIWINIIPQNNAHCNFFLKILCFYKKFSSQNHFFKLNLYIAKCYLQKGVHSILKSNLPHFTLKFKHSTSPPPNTSKKKPYQVWTWTNPNVGFCPEKVGIFINSFCLGLLRYIRSSSYSY